MSLSSMCVKNVVQHSPQIARRTPIQSPMSTKILIYALSGLKVPRHNRQSVRLYRSTQVFNDGIIPMVGGDSIPGKRPVDTFLRSAQISKEAYDEIADKTLDALMATLDEHQERSGNMELENNSGILTIEIPNRGTWVINKQPPNKQIWLSSPESGPKRYDWVVIGESMYQKEGGGGGDWIYLRDGSSLSSLMRKELGIKFSFEVPPI